MLLFTSSVVDGDTLVAIIFESAGLPILTTSMNILCFPNSSTLMHRSYPYYTVSIVFCTDTFVYNLTMSYVLSIFKVASLIFYVAPVITGLQAIINPTTFAQSFGIPVTSASTLRNSDSLTNKPLSSAGSYVSLMGVRQLSTGLTLLMFAYRRKWFEMATILAILGIMVAGTDGIYLAQAGNYSQARFHAIPGAGIALLSAAVVYTCRS